MQQHQQQLQVLLRLRVVRPAAHGTVASLRLNLEGAQLNARGAGGSELLHLTLSRLQCAALVTARERMLSVALGGVQLDNQLLETRHPVVLAPASLAAEVWVCRAACTAAQQQRLQMPEHT
jgi:hypothetical protein